METYRSIIWYLKGRSHFTKAGYEKASKNFLSDDLNVNLDSKTVIVTGGNSGLGKATAHALAEKGAKVYLVCRNVETAKEALKEIKNGDVFEMDLSLPQSIAKFVDQFTKTVGKLDILVIENINFKGE